MEAVLVLRDRHDRPQGGLREACAPMIPWRSGRIILASTSPRRAELLALAGLAVEILPSGVDEALFNGESPRDHVLRLAEAKAEAASRRRPEAWVLGADTVVVVDETILGKPSSPAEARAMLDQLSGRAHEVITGFCILRRQAGIHWADAVASQVLFRPLSTDETAWYAATSEPYDKAGAYAVQGVAACFIREVRGSYTNVVGLPLCEVVEALRRLGAIVFDGDEDGHRR